MTSLFCLGEGFPRVWYRDGCVLFGLRELTCPREAVRKTVREMRSSRSSRRSGRSCQMDEEVPTIQLVPNNKEIDEHENRKAPVF